MGEVILGLMEASRIVGVAERLSRRMRAAPDGQIGVHFR
jgi:hypothetical protein